MGKAQVCWRDRGWRAGGRCVEVEEGSVEGPLEGVGFGLFGEERITVWGAAVEYGREMWNMRPTLDFGP